MWTPQRAKVGLFILHVMIRKGTNLKDAPSLQPREMPVELDVAQKIPPTGMRPSPGAVRHTLKPSPAKLTPSTVKRSPRTPAVDPLATQSIAPAGIDPDSDWLEEAKYPLKHTLCVDALTRGFYDAFSELFQLTHTNIMHSLEHGQEGTAAESATEPSYSDEDLIFLRDSLCAADAARRERMCSESARCLPCRIGERHLCGLCSRCKFL